MGTITYREVDEPPYEVYHVSTALIGVDSSQRIMGPHTIREEVIGMYNIHLISYVRLSQLKWGGKSGGIRVGS